MSRSSPLLLLVVVAALALALAPRTACAQQPPAGPFLIASGTTDANSQRYAKLVATEVSRRAFLVAETEAGALLERPLSAAVADCSGDDLCFVALGQVIKAATVVVVTVKDSAAEAGKFDCAFRVIDVKTGRAATAVVFRVTNSDAGLLTAAAASGERIVPRPRAVTVATPTPLVVAPTPALVAPTPTPAASPSVVAFASDTPEPTATPGTSGLDVVPDPPRPRKPRPPLTKDPAFWGMAGAGVLVLGLGAFFGASSFNEEPKEEGTSTVEVHF